MFTKDEEVLQIHRAILLDKDSPIKNLDAKTGQIPINNELEEYIYNCSKSLGAIDRAIDKSHIAIKQVKTCLSRFPKNTEFSRADYMEFALENYIIRSRSIYDRVLIFLVSLFDLGISNDSVNNNLLITNRHVKRDNIQTLLKPIKKACDTYQFKRNVIIHHDNLIDEEFDTVSLIVSTNHLSAKDGKDEPFTKGKVDFYSKQIMKSKTKEYTKNLNDIVDSILPLYEACEVIYLNRKLKILKSMK